MKPLIHRIKEDYPLRTILISTMTRNGYLTAQKIHPEIKTMIFPLDIYTVMLKTFKNIDPGMIIIAETELWPNMLAIAQKKNIPVLIANGRISDKTFKTYMRTRFLWQSFSKGIKSICAQSEKDRLRFKELGFKQVQAAGNLKFCLDLPLFSRIDLRTEWGFKSGDLIITFGSSRPGEEQLILDAFRKLKVEYAQLKLILVPRHLERLPEVLSLIPEYGLYSQMKKGCDILVIDKMGILTQAYALSDIAVVGGSFFDFGGHNPLEAAFYRLPVIMGKFHQSCVDSVDKLLHNEAMIVSDSGALTNNLRYLLQHPEKRAEFGANAKRTLTMYNQSLEIHIKEVAKYI